MQTTLGIYNALTRIINYGFPDCQRESVRKCGTNACFYLESGGEGLLRDSTKEKIFRTNADMIEKLVSLKQSS